MDVEKQILIIWAATNGYIDDVAIENVRRFEMDLQKFVRTTRRWRYQQAEDSDGRIKKDQSKCRTLKQLEARKCKSRRSIVPSNAESPGHSPANKVGKEHAADHQGHENGLGGEAQARTRQSSHCSAIC
jgi:hypothetical protein